MDIISTINNSIEILSKLRSVSENIREAEIKNAIADLSLELADVKLAAAELKEEIVRLKEENSELKSQKAPREVPDLKSGCYYFDGDSTRLYCTACYDSKGAKILTAQGPGGYRICGVCKAVHKR